MKHFSFFFSFVLIFNFLIAQTHTESFVACSKSYLAICDLQNDNSITITIKDGLDTTNNKRYSIFTSDIDVFANTFQQFFSQLKGLGSCTSDDQGRIVSYGRSLYLNYLKSLSDTISPRAGVIKLCDSTKSYVRYGYGEPKHRRVQTEVFGDGVKGAITKAQIEISEGYITNLKVYVVRQGKTYQYILPFAIGISSVANFKKYKGCKLYEINSSVYFRNPDKYQRKMINSSNSKMILDSTSYIVLGDVLIYDYDYQVDRRDYSPKNQKFNLDGGQSVILYKAPTDKLFEAHIFTDFIGLQEEKPNGLVQTELSKRININSVQSILPPFFYNSFIRSVGVFQYISPSVSLTKLEQHNSRLILGDLDSVRFNPGRSDVSKINPSIHRYTTALNLYQYQSFAAGFDVNVFYFNNNDLKYAFEMNFGARLSITKVTDSLTTISNNVISKTSLANSYSINTLQYYPELLLTFLPEERFNLSISERAIYSKPLNSNLQLVMFDKDDYSKIYAKKTSWINSVQMSMTIQLNPTSKLFGRVRFNSEWQNSRNNFAQVQVGYSTFILGR